MSSLITSRRTFIGGLASLIAAPAIVRVSSLMPVKVVDLLWAEEAMILPPGEYHAYLIDITCIGDRWCTFQVAYNVFEPD